MSGASLAAAAAAAPQQNFHAKKAMMPITMAPTAPPITMIIPPPEPVTVASPLTMVTQSDEPGTQADVMLTTAGTLGGRMGAVPVVVGSHEPPATVHNVV